MYLRYMGGHLAPECLWILDKFDVSREQKVLNETV